MSAEEFLAYADQHPDKRFDFDDGEMVETFAKPVQGRIHTAFISALSNYNKQNSLGLVYASALHVLDGEKLMPEVCINVATEADYLTTPPIVAVEIRSDSQTRASQRRKAESYIRHGAKMVILCFPREQVEVYFAGQDVIVLGPEDSINGGEVLPGFTLPVRDVL
jgi:Uma2 family endonuclease